MCIPLVYDRIMDSIKAYGLNDVLDALNTHRELYCCKHPVVLASMFFGSYDREKFLVDILGCAMIDSMIKCLQLEQRLNEKCSLSNEFFDWVKALYDVLKKQLGERYVENTCSEVVSKIYLGVKELIELELIRRKLKGNTRS
ncbi:MAG: hypothetical protein J7J82_04935 [Staphylothermus sp.]|nr:hypothetical protein [Staphylothermus sp.]